jgi:hypothetical protein
MSPITRGKKKTDNRNRPRMKDKIPSEDVTTGIITMLKYLKENTVMRKNIWK